MGNLGILVKRNLDPFLEVGPGLMPQIRPTGRGLTTPRFPQVMSTLLDLSESPRDYSDACCISKPASLINMGAEKEFSKES